MTISNIFLSATIFVLVFVLFGNEQGTYLVHAKEPLLALIVTVIVLILLNRKLKNPLLDIVNLIFVVLFLLRIPFLYGEDLISDIYFRDVNIGNVSYALYVLTFQLIVLALCVILINPARILNEKFKVSNEVWSRVLRFTALIFLINIFYIVFIFKLGEDNIPSPVAIFLAIFNWSSATILIVPLIIFKENNIKMKYRVNLYIQLTVFVLLVMYTGSKSGLFQIFEIYAVAFLVIHGSSFRVPLRTLIVTIFFLIIAMMMFLLGEIFNKIQRGQVSFDDGYGLFILSLDNLSVIINSISYRMGYFDFYIDKLTHEVYDSSFNLKYYFMAFINSVTPGFDVFESTPLVSRKVYIDYFGKSDGPNSEVVTVFAEAHRLASYFSFFVYSFVLWVILLVRKYGIHFTSDYGKVMLHIFICYIFLRYMLGMGIDYWLFGDVIYPIIFLTLSFNLMGLSWSKNTGNICVT